MRRMIALLAALLLAIGMLAVPALAQGQGTGGNAAKSLGKTTLDAEVGWLVGSGQFDGEFVTAELQGVVIGLRAQHRFEGLLGVSGTNGNRVGVYEAETGDTGGNNATWNYDWHVDLSDATNAHEGRTLEDYRLVLWQDFTEESLFGLLGHDPVVLAEGGEHSCTEDYGSDDAPGEIGVDLCEQSWNPGFGNTDFNPDTEDTYNLRLVLTPETFNGPPIAVSIQVDVTD